MCWSYSQYNSVSVNYQGKKIYLNVKLIIEFMISGHNAQQHCHKEKKIYYCKLLFNK